jgi:hypothetical protein
MVRHVGGLRAMTFLLELRFSLFHSDGFENPENRRLRNDIYGQMVHVQVTTSMTFA